MALEWLFMLVGMMVAIIAMAAVLVLINRMHYRIATINNRYVFRRSPDGNEYRAVIFKAFQRIEANFERYGIPRHGCETVRQYLARAAEQLAVDRKALRDFLDTYERARYSDHPHGEPERGRAINALRAVQYSLEKIKLTEEQLSALMKLAGDGGRPVEPRPETLEALGLWVVAPFVAGSVNIPYDREGKYRDQVDARDSGKGELLRKYGSPNVKDDTRLPDDELDRLRGLVAGKLHAGLGTRLLELAGGPARGWRVGVEPTLASYLLEFVARLADSGRAGRPPTLDDSKVMLLAATVLAVADGRDFLIPDDLKLALVGAGPLVYHTDTRDIVHVLDEEIRRLPGPKGPEFMMPRPILVRGLTVPAA